MKSKHICREIRYCNCMSNAVDPDESCLIHGLYRQPRCSYCGKFLMHDPIIDIFRTAAKHGWYGSSEKDGHCIIFKFFDYETENTASSSRD